MTPAWEILLTVACPLDRLCPPCAGLLAECGPDLFETYRKKLLIRGWAGQYSPVERAYVRVHRSEARSLDAERRAASLAGRVSNRPQGASAPEAVDTATVPS